MKKIVGLVVLLAAMVLGAYYGMGYMTERTLKKNIAVMNQSHGLTIDVKEYQRGWFNSAAKLQWHIQIPARTVVNKAGENTVIPAKNIEFPMMLSIMHGPIIYADGNIKLGLGYARSEIALPDSYNAEFASLFASDSIKPIVGLTVFVDYFNGSHMQIGLPKFNLRSNLDNMQFQWLGMMSDVRFTKNMNNIDGELTVDGISYVKNKDSVVLGPITSDYDLHLAASGLYFGDANANISSLLVSYADKNTLRLEKFALHTNTNVHDGLFDAEFKTSMQKMFRDGKNYGPSLLDVSVKNLDADVVARLNDQVNQMQQMTSDERQKLVFTMLPELTKLFARGAEFEVSKFSFVLPEGVMHGQLLFSLPKGDLGNPFQLMQKIQGEGKLVIAKNVLKLIVVNAIKNQQRQETIAQQEIPTTPEVKPVDTATPQTAPVVSDLEQRTLLQADQKIAALVQAGALAVQDNDYVIAVKLAEGQLLVNDKPLSQEMMQF